MHFPLRFLSIPDLESRTEFLITLLHLRQHKPVLKLDSEALVQRSGSRLVGEQQHLRESVLTDSEKLLACGAPPLHRHELISKR